MRSGIRSECRRRWTPEAHRPKCKLKLGYEYGYLYAALNPYPGALFCLLLPDMTKESFCAFTAHFSRYLDTVYGAASAQRRKVLRIGDGAGAHQKNCVWPKALPFKSCRLPPPNSTP